VVTWHAFWRRSCEIVARSSGVRLQARTLIVFKLALHLQILAASSKRQLGSLRFQEAVLTSLTALSRSASSITHRNVDTAVDYVFEQVTPLAELSVHFFAWGSTLVFIKSNRPPPPPPVRLHCRILNVCLEKATMCKLAGTNH
jgi:hypothetical protein